MISSTISTTVAMTNYITLAVYDEGWDTTPTPWQTGAQDVSRLEPQVIFLLLSFFYSTVFCLWINIAYE
jgi:hypothetical protein